MRLRTLILPLFLAGGLSSVFVLPQTGAVAQSAINMTLPATIGNWQLKPIPPTQAEIDILSKDTKFAKAICVRPSSDEFFATDESNSDRADLSIVLSGYDLNNSIHRPERCMPAQGHRDLRATSIPLTLANGRKLTVRRIRSVQTVIPNPKDRSLDQHFECITYYFFVGHERVESDHFQRTFTDMKDRLIRGIDQRWAYVTMSMWFGQLPGREQPVTESQADAKLLSLVTEFAAQQLNWKQLR